MLHRLLTPLGLGDWISLEGIRDSTQNIVWHLPRPRVLLGMLVGLPSPCRRGGDAGFHPQSLARNPTCWASPPGASLGAVLAMLVGVWLPMGRLSVPTGAFVGALVSILLVYGLSRSGGAVTPVRLILVGVAVSAMFQAFTNYLVYTAPDDAAVREATFWMLGGLGSAKWEDLPLLATDPSAPVPGADGPGPSPERHAHGDSSAVTLGWIWTGCGECSSCPPPCSPPPLWR